MFISYLITVFDTLFVVYIWCYFCAAVLASRSCFEHR